MTIHLPGYDDVLRASVRLKGVAHRTPVLTSRLLDRRTGGHVFLKCENLQRAGAFKFRGAYYALSQLSPHAGRLGVLAYSSGNHGQAIALAGRLLSLPVTLVMPDDAPMVKLDAARAYGAEVITYDRFKESREQLAARLAAERNLPLIPSFDHPDVIAGQGTAAKELFEEVGPLDWLLVPCGGGGLLSGSALSARSLSPKCRVIGVEPEAGDDATRSFRTGTLHRTSNPLTIADGARTPSLGVLTFPLVLRHVSDMVTVSEAALRRAILYVWERLKLIVEPTGALAVAALLDSAVDVRGGRVGVVLSGGNVDVLSIAGLLSEQ